MLNLESEIHALRALVGNGLGEEAGAALEALRARYRRAPGDFAAADLEALRTLAADLKALPPRPLDLPARLKATFGFDSFRPGQEAVVRAVMAGRDCLAVMPTGAGKSLTYQLPARLLGGTTLVISPLIALMKDQVDALQEAGLRATFLNSSLDPAERAERIRGLRQGAFELVYAAPEGIEQSVGPLLDSLDLRLIAVDEAHCISHWGHDFRPAYRNLAGLKARFGGLPVLALTATATDAVQRDIVDQLGMVAPLVHTGSFFRANLKLHAVKKGPDSPGVKEAILRLIQHRPGESGIVYCLSRKSAEATAEHLREHGIAARAYHAGLAAPEREAAQEAFRRDQAEVVCATIAFGMGIDKSNIRYVIHRDMPKTVEGWYQEIGRAGRDGADADCVLFYSWADVMSLERFLDGLEPPLAAVQRRQIRDMYSLAETTGCLHQALVGHFGERIPACGDACACCSGRDVLAEAPRRRKVKGRPVPAEGPPPAEGDQALLVKLKALRRHLADERNIPSYLVFNDATLQQMVRFRPGSPAELAAINGVGPHKLAQYGPAFLEVLRETVP